MAGNVGINKFVPGDNLINNRSLMIEGKLLN